MEEPSSATLPDSNIAGLVTTTSPYSVDSTIDRFEEALAQRRFVIFARLDHAAAAKYVGLDMPRETVIVFGNPLVGTPAFLNTPTLGIDFPLRAMVLENADGQVFLSYKSADYIFNTIYARHGAQQDNATIAKFENALETIAEETVN